MERKGKILTVCRWGNIRSVALARLLKKEGYDTLACGVYAQSEETLAMLCTWADLIMVADKKFITFLPVEVKEKIIDTEIGEDKWNDADHPELMTLVKRIYYANKARLWELKREKLKS